MFWRFYTFVFFSDIFFFLAQPAWLSPLYRYIARMVPFKYPAPINMMTYSEHPYLRRSCVYAFEVLTLLDSTRC